MLGKETYITDNCCNLVPNSATKWLINLCKGMANTKNSTIKEIIWVVDDTSNDTSNDTDNGNIDKWKAKKSKWCIREASLLGLAYLVEA